MKAAKTFELRRSVTSKDKYGELHKDNYTTITKVAVSVYCTKENITQYNPEFYHCDYIGVYKGYLTFEKTDRLDNQYEIIKIVSAGRKTILYMKDVV